MDIGVLIRRYRTDNDLTLREFASRCGTSHSYIAMLENNKNSKTGEPIVPTIAMIKKLSKGMNVSVNDLISMCDDIPISLDTSIDIKLAQKNSPEEPKLSEREKALLDLFRLVPEDKQQMLFQMIQVALGKI